MIACVCGPSHSIELIEYNGPAERSAVRPRACDTGFSHIAYDVTGPDELLAAAATHGVAAERQVITVDQEPNQRARVVYLRDTEGITFEIIQKPA
jgi:catechol 2,3-dioxygenase-like lactoylglutathione lyase family enzyme